ncbi:hypothetical protein D7B24_007729 [Verticillium nonalfalfae]|uniref:Uncharacterized protein n=1 Tax=Verticillium nonalfalfae TaxID=1051616 RepID=A0A3M9Y749_9PEZI|nr:uncharacterized protein D7B24_007729 [Verticillium nonalfalfae]RNJ56061.1 hypothetical protein D7B24_007729 [Verticillium nonalfalfae]
MPHPPPEKPLPEPPRTRGVRLQARLASLLARVTKPKPNPASNADGDGTPPPPADDGPPHPLQTTTLYPPDPPDPKQTRSSGRKLARSDAARRTSALDAALASLRRRGRKTSDVRPGYFDAGGEEPAGPAAESAEGLEMNVAGSAIPSILEEPEPAGARAELTRRHGNQGEARGHEHAGEEKEKVKAAEH